MDACTSYTKTMSDLWDKYSPIVKATPLASYAELADKMVGFWNSIVGNSFLKIGPRKLIPGQTLVGHLVGGTERLFVASVATKRAGTLRFEKTNGGAGATVKICGFDQRDGHRDLETFTVDDEAKDGRTWEVPIPADSMVTVKLEGSGGILKKLDYELKVSA